MGEKQKWYCDVCKNGINYTLAGKWCHLNKKIHKINQSRLDREAVYKEYIMRSYHTLMANTEISPLSKYLKKSVLVYRKLKKDFKLFYDSNCDSDCDYDCDSDRDSDSDSDFYFYSDSDSDFYSDSDDENTKYQDYVESRYNLFMKNNIYLCLPEFLKKRALVYKLIKLEFKHRPK